MEKKNEKNEIKEIKEKNEKNEMEGIERAFENAVKNGREQDLWSDSAKDEEKSVQFYYSQSWDSSGKSIGMGGVSYNSDLIEDVRRRDSQYRRKSSVSDTSCKGCLAF